MTAPKPKRRTRKLTSVQLRKKYKFVVTVPKPSARAYNPKRAVGSLVTHQLQHLQFAMQALPNWHRNGVTATDVKTEGGAAAFVARATDLLHRASAPAKTPNRPRRRPAGSARRKKMVSARRRTERGRPA